MQTAAGIFRTRGDAEAAVAALGQVGVGRDRLALLTPDTGSHPPSVPTTEAEPPGVAPALGAVAGGAAGAAHGMALGALVSLFVPGVGAILAGGVLGAAAAGVAGAAAGQAFERSLDIGLPKDELHLYEDALRHGRSVVVALVDAGEEAAAARRALTQAGAESLDAAREQWWVGLRDIEREHETRHGGAFDRDEPLYRRGFEAALDSEHRGRPYEAVRARLQARYPEAHATEAFRRGYERGQAWWARCCEAARRAA